MHSLDAFDVARLALMALVLLLIGLYFAMTAGRLDRLHIRYDAAITSLDLQFAQRAETIAEMVAEGFIDPVSAQLLGRALAARRFAQPGNLTAESELSALLREVVDAHEGVVAPADLQQELRSACNRVEFAYRFLNEAAETTLAMRNRPWIKRLGLAGHTAFPSPIRCDVRAPEFAP